MTDSLDFRLPMSVGAVAAPVLSYMDDVHAPAWLSALTSIPELVEYKRKGFALAEIQSGCDVLDVGCGVGTDALLMGQLIGPSGSVTGVDISPAMLERARENWAAARIDAPIGRFERANAMELPFPDESFDVVRADRALQHVAQPLVALRECLRVLRPGGRCVITEPDWKAMTVYPGGPEAGDDDSVVCEVLAWQAGHIAHPTIGRQLRALLTGAGVADATVSPTVMATVQLAVADLALELRAVTERMLASEDARISREAAAAWWAQLEHADNSGTFFASVCYFYGHGRKS